MIQCHNVPAYVCVCVCTLPTDVQSLDDQRLNIMSNISFSFHSLLDSGLGYRNWSLKSQCRCFAEEVVTSLAPKLRSLHTHCHHFTVYTAKHVDSMHSLCPPPTVEGE